MHLRTRRQLALAITVSLIVLVWVASRLESVRLGSPAMLTGWTVLACVVGLMMIGVRRRLPFLPLGNVSAWTQTHLYLGIFTAAVYVFHVPHLFASGVFEGALSMLFLTAAASGFYGIFVSRTLPKRLTAVETQVRFDRVKWHRKAIHDTAEQIVQNLVEPTARELLQSLYQRNLQAYFASGPSPRYVLFPSSHRRREMMSVLNELDRYLEQEGRHAAGQFAALVRRRDELDYQFALQLRLRSWLVFHLFVSVLLMAASLIHAVMVLRFT